jgi:hypothetical protein
MHRSKGETLMVKPIAILLGSLLVLTAPVLAGDRDAVADGEPSQFELAGIASGLGVNLAAVGRLVGSGNTLFKTAVDVGNNSASAAQIDFYFDGTSAGASLAASGSLSSSGALVARGTGGTVRGHSNIHYDDFVDALVGASLLPSSVETNGILGSTLFVFNGFSKSGQGSATARFYNSAFGGTIGQAINGREITTSEPTKLVVTARNTVGKSGPQLYSNLFVNNLGLTPTGSGTPSAVNVLVSASSNSSGNPVGTPFTITGLAPGATTVVAVFAQLAIPASEDTVLLTINVVSGTSAIDAVIDQIDNTTHDGTSSKAVNGAF